MGPGGGTTHSSALADLSQHLSLGRAGTNGGTCCRWSLSSFLHVALPSGVSLGQDWKVRHKTVPQLSGAQHRGRSEGQGLSPRHVLQFAGESSKGRPGLEP